MAGPTGSAAQTPIRPSNTLDTKTAQLCENVKANGTSEANDDIRLYTITFGSMSAANEALMRNCASLDVSGQPLYFHAPTTVRPAGHFRRRSAKI